MMSKFVHVGDQLVKIPKVCKKHNTRWKKIDLSRNWLTEFSKTFPNLTCLVLNENQFTKFSYASGTLQNLQLIGNNLESFDGSALLNLRQLQLGYNKLTSFDMVAPELRILTINDNKLASFNIVAPKLEYLYLAYNCLTSFNMTLDSLTVLRLHYNQLESFSVVAPNLQSLWLNNNRLIAFNANFPNVEDIYLMNNPLLVVNCTTEESCDVNCNIESLIYLNIDQLNKQWGISPDITYRLRRNYYLIQKMKQYIHYINLMRIVRSRYMYRMYDPSKQPGRRLMDEEYHEVRWSP